jgi:hypothetical protein
MPVRRDSGRGKSMRAAIVDEASLFSRGFAGMPPSAVPMVSGVEIQRSRQLMRDSRTLIVLARELVRQSRWLISQQIYLQIVCAWCQQTICWQRAAGTAWGQISHSICYDCFAHVFGELAPRHTPPPLSPQVTAGDHASQGLQLREEARRAAGTDTMADLAKYRGLLAHPANVPLTPRTHN